MRRLLIVAVCLVLIAATAAAVPPARAQIALTVWHSWNGTPAEALARWLAEYPPAAEGRTVFNVVYVPFFTFQNQLKTPPDGRGPDMYIGPSDWVGALVRERLATALDSRLTPAYRAELIPAAWPLVTVEGRVVGVPFALEGAALFYNRDLVTDASIAATWEGLIRAAGALQNADRVGVALAPTFYPTAGLYFAAGGTLPKPGERIAPDAPALIAYRQALAALAQAPGILTTAPDGGFDAFRGGQAAFLLGLSADYPIYRETLGEKLGVLPLPTIGGAAWQSLIRAQVVYVAAGTPFSEAALDFARYLTSEAAQGVGIGAGLLPVRAGFGTDDPVAGPMLQALTAAGVPMPPHMPEIWPQFR